MTKFDLAMATLAGVGMVGIFVLIGLDKEIDVALPIVTALVGWLTGKTQIIERATGAIFKK